MPLDKSIKTVLIIGSGPIVIGQACEFDYSGTQAARSLSEEGIKVILINSNPATIMTDPMMADKVYLLPLTVESIEQIIEENLESEFRIDAVLAKIDSILFKPTVGGSYQVKVIKMLDFGAVVEYTDAPGNEVLLHVSELAWERTENVTDVVHMGDVFQVKYFGVDPKTRKEKVSRKALLDKPEGYVARPPRDDSRNGGRDSRGGSRDNRSGGRDSRDNNRGRDDRRDDRKPREDRKED